MVAPQSLAPKAPHSRSVGDLKNLEGTEPEPDITQDVTASGFLTGDEQWIHLEPERADAGAFGSTFAHGLYSLSRGPASFGELMALDRLAHAPIRVAESVGRFSEYAAVGHA